VPADQLWAMLRADGKGLLDTAAATISAHPTAVLEIPARRYSVARDRRLGPQVARRCDRDRHARSIGTQPSRVREYGRRGHAPRAMSGRPSGIGE
jgi:hypothetical protein